MASSVTRWSDSLKLVKGADLLDRMSISENALTFIQELIGGKAKSSCVKSIHRNLAITTFAVVLLFM